MVLINFKPQIHYCLSLMEAIPVLNPVNCPAEHYSLHTYLDDLLDNYLPEKKAIEELASFLYLISGEI